MMNHFMILEDLLVVYVVAGLVVFVFHRLRIPTVAGLLVAGMLVGPYGLGLVGEVEQVKLLAEVGIVVLLFAVGLEFSLSRLLTMWREMLGIGLPQVLICVVVTAAATRWYVDTIGAAIFAGMLVAMSSTAVVIKLLIDRGELGSPQGRLGVAVLLLQDLLVIVFMLIIPLLTEQKAGGRPLWIALLQGVAVVVLVLVGSRYAMPPLLYQVVRTRNRELFLISIFLLCIGTAMLTAWAGLSLALGAFLAGLAVSESEYAHQMFAEVAPFRDTLSSLFFVSVGMLLDLNFVLGRLPLVLATVAAVMALKSTATALPTLALGHTPRVAVLTGAALLQLGEFSFLLAGRGREVGLMRGDDYQTFLAAAVLTMLLTPFVMGTSHAVANRVVDTGWLGRLTASRQDSTSPEIGGVAQLRDHVIIIGFGVAGQNLARVLRSVEIPYVILEMNPESVRRSKAEGEPISFGDCTQEAMLEHLGIQRAQVMVLVISDPSSTRRAVQLARRLNPRIHLVVRTRYVAEVEGLKALGADEIVPEELVTSVDIFARVLHEYQVPRNQTQELVDRIRSDQYQVLRVERTGKLNLLEKELAELAELESCLITAGSPAVGQTLGTLRLRAETGATLLALKRKTGFLSNPDADVRIEAGDVAVLFGDREQLDRAFRLLDPETAGASAGA